MHDIEALDSLLEKVKAGDDAFPDGWGWREFNVFGGCHEYSLASKARMAFNGSLDAAKALHEAVLPGWDCTLSIGASHASLSEPIGRDPTRGWYPGPEAEADTPARAWLIAVLEGLKAKMQQGVA